MQAISTIILVAVAIALSSIFVVGAIALSSPLETHIQQRTQAE